MGPGDAAIMAGVLGALMGVIEVAKILAKRAENGKGKKSDPPPAVVVTTGGPVAPDPCHDCRKSVSDTAHNVIEVREENARLLTCQQEQLQVMHRMADGIGELVALHRGPGRTGEIPIPHA